MWGGQGSPHPVGAPCLVRVSSTGRPASVCRLPGACQQHGAATPEALRSALPPFLQARQPGLFEVKVTTPPPQSLGIYALPPLTHTGEEIEIDGQGYIVTALNVMFRLGEGVGGWGSACAAAGRAGCVAGSPGG